MFDSFPGVARLVVDLILVSPAERLRSASISENPTKHNQSFVLVNTYIFDSFPGVSGSVARGFVDGVVSLLGAASGYEDDF
jgi:hypothetical protein